MDFDHILEYLGEFGTFQRKIYTLMFISTISLGANMMSFVFNSVVPNYRCFVNDCDTDNTTYNAKWLNNYSQIDLKISQCSYKSTSKVDCMPSSQNFTDGLIYCTKWKYDQSFFQSTVVSEWDLVCDKSWLNTLSASIWMIGLTVGALLFGQISDRYGRKFALTNAAALNVIICFILPFSINFIMFLIMRFLQAIVSVGFFETATILGLEFVGQSKRVLCGTGMAIGFCFGSVGVGILSYLVPHWRHLHFYLAFPSLIFLIFFWTLPESVRWLILHKKYEQAIEVISKMALINRVSLPDKILNYEKVDKQNNKKVSSSITQLFKDPVLKWRTINIFFIWCFIVFGYYGISMNTVNLGGNIFINFILASLIELPALILCIMVLDRAGRRIPLVLLLVIGGFFSLATVFIPKADYTHWVTIAFVLVAKFGVSAAYSVIILFTAELLPTCLRNSGLGMSAFFANAGAMIAPYVSSLSSNNKELPLLIFGISLIISGMLVFNLPETLGKVLPETIADAENFGKQKNKSSRLPAVYIISIKKRETI